MATLANDAGLFRVVVKSSARPKGYPIRLGRIKPALAEQFRGRVGELEDYAALGQEPSRKVKEWLNSLSPEVYEKLVSAGLTTSRVNMLLRGWLEKHLDSKVTMRPRAKKNLQQTHLKLYAFPAFGDSIQIDRITPDHAGDWHTWLHTLGLSDATIRTHVGNAKSIFAAAAQRKIIAENPFARLPSGPTAGGEAPYVRPEDAERIVHYLPDARYRLLFGLGRYAGLRIPSETRSLIKADVDLAAGLLRVRCVKTSGYVGKEMRFVPICGRLRPLIVERLRQLGPDESLCPIGSVSGIGGYPRRVIERAMSDASVQPYTGIFQSLRSSLAKEWKSAGIEEYAVDACLGHNNVTSRRHYTSSVPPETFGRIARVVDAARNAARNAAEVGGSKGDNAEQAKPGADGKPRFPDGFREVPSGTASREIGVTGFEPAASWSRTKRSTKLSYTPDACSPRPGGHGRG